MNWADTPRARYLLERGHRRIGVITHVPERVAIALRLKDIRRPFAEAGAPIDARLVLQVNAVANRLELYRRQI